MKLKHMHSGLAILILLAAVFGLATCSNQKKLYIYNWTYYTPPELIQGFEKATGVRVVYDTYDSNEAMFAKLKAGGGSYDIVFPSVDYVSIMIKQGMLLPIDKSKIPNFKNIDPKVLGRSKDYDPDNTYSVPYYMGAAGVAVNKSFVKDYSKSWSIFARTDLKKKMTMLDDMREVFGDALAYMGKSVNSVSADEINAAKQLILTTWWPNLIKFDSEGFAKGFKEGDFWVCQGYAENIFTEYPKDKWSDIDFFIPAEGGPSFIDSMVILKGAKNADLALKFIDYVHTPEVYANAFCDYFGFPSTVNIPARDLKKGVAHYSVEDVDRCELKLDVGADLDLYNKAWQDIKVKE